MFAHYANTIADYWNSRKENITASATIILVALLAFGLGRLSKLEDRHLPIRTIDGSLATSSTATDETQKSAEAPFVASRSGKFYYAIWCDAVNKIQPKNRLFFATREEAEREHYIKAKNCPGL